MQELFFASSGKKLFGILDHHSDGIVLIIHGHSSSSSGLSSKLFFKELSRRKISSFRIDLSGCGKSEGKFENHTITSDANNVVSAVNFLRKRGYSHISLCGGSAGGLAVMAAALKIQGIEKIGLRAPVSDYPSKYLHTKGRKYISNWKKDGYVLYDSGDRGKIRLNYSFYEDSKKHVMYKKVGKIRCPVLIVHGTEDEQVDINDSRKLVKCFPDARLVELKGANHRCQIGGSMSKCNRLLVDFFEQRAE